MKTQRAPLALGLGILAILLLSVTIMTVEGVIPPTTIPDTYYCNTVGDCPDLYDYDGCFQWACLAQTCVPNPDTISTLNDTCFDYSPSVRSAECRPIEVTFGGATVETMWCTPTSIYTWSEFSAIVSCEDNSDCEGLFSTTTTAPYSCANTTICSGGYCILDSPVNGTSCTKSENDPLNACSGGSGTCISYDVYLPEGYGSDPYASYSVMYPLQALACVYDNWVTCQNFSTNACEVPYCDASNETCTIATKDCGGNLCYTGACNTLSGCVLEADPCGDPYYDALCYSAECVPSGEEYEGECVFAEIVVCTDDDSDVCTIPVCSGGACSQVPIDIPSSYDSCRSWACTNPTGLQLVYASDGTTCSVSNFDPICREYTTCANGECQTAKVNCDDANACTSDYCDPGLNRCIHAYDPLAFGCTAEPSPSPSATRTRTPAPSLGITTSTDDTSADSTDADSSDRDSSSSDTSSSSSSTSWWGENKGWGIAMIVTGAVLLALFIAIAVYYFGSQTRSNRQL